MTACLSIPYNGWFNSRIRGNTPSRGTPGGKKGPSSRAAGYGSVNA
jgi:hypothetical protein